MEAACAAVLATVAVLSLAGFSLATHDKRRARSGGRRVPEQRLLLVAFLGGWPGLLLAFLAVRHKTRKGRFLVPFLLAAVVNAAALLLLLRAVGCV